MCINIFLKALATSVSHWNVSTVALERVDTAIQRTEQVYLIFLPILPTVSSFFFYYRSFSSVNVNSTKLMDPHGSKQALSLMYGVGTLFLEESEHFEKTKPATQDKAVVWLNIKRSVSKSVGKGFITS